MFLGVFQGLPTLDTSSPLLSRWSHDNASNMQGAYNVTGLDVLSSEKQSRFASSTEVNPSENKPTYALMADDAAQALLPSLWEARQDYCAIGREYTYKEAIPHHTKDEVNILGYGSLESLVSGHNKLASVDSWQSGNNIVSSKKELT